VSESRALLRWRAALLSRRCYNPRSRPERSVLEPGAVPFRSFHAIVGQNHVDDFRIDGDDVFVSEAVAL